MPEITIAQLSGAFTRTQARIHSRRMTREEHEAAQADLNLLESVLGSAIKPAPQPDPAPRGKPKVAEHPESTK